MINNVVLVGRTTKNIELKQNKNGTNYVQFTLAVNRPFKDKQADYIQCVAWNKTTETMANYVLKGTMIGVEGRLQVRSYSNEAGVRQYLSEVLVNRLTFLESKKSSALPEPVDPFNPATESNPNPFDPNFSNHNYTPTSQQGMQNYNSPFATATTLAGSLKGTMNSISLSDDD